MVGGLKLWGMLGGGAALAFLIWGTLSGFTAKGDLGELRADVASCSRAAEKQAESTERCSEPVAVAIAAARAARQCDIALATPNRNATLFAIRTTCSTAVKAEMAARTAAEDGQRAAEAEIDRLIADQAGIATRAEARGAEQSKRKEAADDAIKSAPSAGPGNGARKHCDAGCLRRLSRAA